MPPINKLVGQSVAAATEDAAWLGSDDHLQLLTEALEDLGAEPEITVQWAPDSYWRSADRLICVERPVVGPPPDSPEHRAERAALDLLHETTHSRFSTPSTMSRQLAALEPQWRLLAELLFNFLEDARISELAIADTPEFAGPLCTYFDEALDAAGESPLLFGPGLEPPDARGQLPYALIAYALRPNRTIELHPAVDAKLVALKPIIDRARTAASTEDCVSAAMELIEQVATFQP